MDEHLTAWQIGEFIVGGLDDDVPHVASSSLPSVWPASLASCLSF